MLGNPGALEMGGCQKGGSTGKQEPTSAAPTMEPQGLWGVPTWSWAISMKEEGRTGVRAAPWDLSLQGARGLGA